LTCFRVDISENLLRGAFAPLSFSSLFLSRGKGDKEG
jgi:hypothetical protein